jgi:voltage-gated potassium channel Kch
VQAGEVHRQSQALADHPGVVKRRVATGLRHARGESLHVPAADRPLLLRFLTDLTLRRAIGAIVIVAFAITLLAALLMLLVERKTYGNYGDACWWSVQTVTTVGYGDNPPVTPAGRVIGAVVMLFGIALIPAITSLVTAVFINQQMRGGSDHRRP